jgi:hypothetical protein
MKVKIMQRSVYHKYAEVEIEIPNIIVRRGQTQEYLSDNEHLYIDKLDTAHAEAQLEFGSGVNDYAGMTDADAELEWRYEVNGQGGHL